jgi:S1-C subfamily serine protease/thioredoxin-related protein
MSMEIRCSCSACQTQFKIGAKYAGRKVKCPKCGDVLVVPAAAPGERPSAIGSGPAAPPASEGSSMGVGPPLGSVPQTIDQPTHGLRKPPVATAPPGAPGAPVPLVVASPPEAAFPIEAPQKSVLAQRGLAKRKSGGGRKTSVTTWIVGGAALMMLLIAVGVGFAIKGLTGGNLIQNDAVLTLKWPEDQRDDATVLINRKPQIVPKSGPVQFTLPPGEHRLFVQRRGYEPVSESFSLGSGERQSYTPQWKEFALASSSAANGFSGAASGFGTRTANFGNGIRGFEQWLQNVDSAKSKAAKDQKDVLIAFICSDFDQATERLRHEVATNSSFTNMVESHFVPVVIDLPRGKEAYNNLPDSAHNLFMKKVYNIQLLPTLVMADAQGQPYAYEIGYRADSPTQYIRRLDELRDERAERDRLFAQAESADGEERLAGAVEAIDWLRKHHVVQFYAKKLREWSPLGEQFDPRNESGRYEVLFEADWFARLMETRQANPDQLPTMVQELERWKQGREFRDNDRAARLHFMAAGVLAETEQREEAAKYADQALAYDPQDESLREGIKLVQGLLGGVLGSGTGFVVDPRGYVLTNSHVVDGPGRMFVRLPGSQEKTPAEMVAQDKRRDIALLRVRLPEGTSIPALPVSEIEVRRGSSIGVFGFPLGEDFGSDLKLTTGVIGGLPASRDDGMLLLDCRVNPGNSGGPLCDRRGQVIGMVTAKSYAGAGVDSYGMALPADMLQAFLKANLPDYSPPPTEETTETLPWDEVDQIVSPSVLMILKVER